MPAPPDLAELCEMVRRNLGARSVDVVADLEEPCPSGVLYCPVPGGGFLAASFDEPCAQRAAMLERLETLVSSFGDLLEALPRATAGPRASAGQSLHEQVVFLAERASAIDVVIIDARSPVVWDSLDGSFVVAEDPEKQQAPDNVRRIDGPAGRPRRVAPDLVARARVLGVRLLQSLVMDPRLVGLVPEATCQEHGVAPLYVAGSRLLLAMRDPSNLHAIQNVAFAAGMDVEPMLADRRLVDLALRWKHRRAVGDVFRVATPETADERRIVADAVRTRWERHFASRMAIELVRRRPEMPALRKGGHLVFGASTDRFGCIARSFAGIYVLVLVFRGAYDEIKAKHAISRALPAIERLVLALPPRDPSPEAGGRMAGRLRRPTRP
jgi:hypothetical protein